MNRKFKLILFILILLAQIIINLYISDLKLNLDLLYLILVFVAVKSNFIKAILVATIIGLTTDYMTGGVLGVFGFSRTMAAFILNEISMRIDLKNNFFVFLMLSLSLAFSNLLANFFFYFIYGWSIQLSLVLYQPFFTALVGILIVSSTQAKKNLDLY
jgi:rod shape-determining protein MreD